MYMDRFQQKAQNCLNNAAQQAYEAYLILNGDKVLVDTQIDVKTGRPTNTVYTAVQRVEAATGLLESAADNARRAKNGLSGNPLDAPDVVREIARELDADSRPATWHDVVSFVLGLSKPRLRRAWNMAMVVLTEEA